MPQNIKTIRRRIRSVKNTRQITRAMEMVSAAKLRRTSLLFEAAKPYTEKMKSLLGRVVSAELMESHPYFQVRPVEKVLVIAFTADKGLCGSFNANLISKTEKHMRALPEGVKADLLLIGRKGWDYFRRRDYNIVNRYTDLSGVPNAEVANEVVRFAVEAFVRGEYDRVDVIYAQYINKMVNRPSVETLLPLGKDMLDEPAGENAEALDAPAEESKYIKHEAVEYIIEPDPASVFDSLIPRYLQGRMYGLMVETLTCEHSARMLAMTNATRNCKDLIDALTLQMNKARQATITKELLDIVGGAEALS